MALCRFLARRGSVGSIWSDNGTNFVGANNELQKALKEMNHQKVNCQDKLTEYNFLCLTPRSLKILLVKFFIPEYNS